MVKIKSIKKIEYTGDVYNLHVADNHNYFANGLMVSNCHLAKAKSITSILDKCTNASIRAGVSGTLDGSLVNELILKGLFGPIHRVAKTSDLIDDGILSALTIKTIILKHDPDAVKQLGKLKYADELSYIVGHERRNKFLCSLAGSTKGNTLILFQFVQKHGKILEKMLRESLPHKKIFFIHGGVPGEERENVRKLAEREGKYVILEFGDIKIKISDKVKVPLNDGTFKAASDITLDDDIADSWIKSYVNAS